MIDNSVAFWLRAAIFAVALWIGVPLITDGLIHVFQIDWAATGWGDCRVDWGAARLFLEHKSPYTEEGLATMNLQSYGFGHPPTTSFWFIPFAKVGYPTMAELVAVLTLAALLFHVTLCVRELDLPGKSALVMLLFGGILTTTWMFYHIIIVQVSEVIAFLMVLGWYFLRRNREVEAGVALGLACTFKLFPGVLVLFLLLTRRFRAFAAAVVSYLAIAAYMTSGYGLASWRDFFRQQGPIANYWVGHIRNASLHGIIARLFRPACERPPDQEIALDIIGKLRRLPHLPPIPGEKLAAILSLALLAVCFWIARKDGRYATTVDVPYGLLSAVAVFVNPWIWEHYNVLLIMPGFVLASATLDQGRRAWTHVFSGRQGVAPGTAKATGMFLFLVLALAGVVKLLAMDTGTPIILHDQYWLHRSANQPIPQGLHLKMHLYEASRWLPWVVTIGALMAVQVARNLRRRRSATTKVSCGSRQSSTTRSLLLLVRAAAAANR